VHYNSSPVRYADATPVADAPRDPRRRSRIVKPRDVTAGRVLLLVCAGLAAPAAAEPTAGELAASCREALAGGFRGISAAACAWYLEPCGACTVSDTPVNDCAPADLGTAARAALLFEQLAAKPGAAAEPAGRVVSALLAARYPCPSGALR